MTPTDELASLAELDPAALEPGVAYGFAKRANQVRVEAASVAWGRRGGRVVSISPGIIATSMGQAELAGPFGEAMRGMIEMSASGRLGTADDIASTVEFLVSPAASFITGVDVHVDGGVVAAVRAAAATGARWTRLREVDPELAGLIEPVAWMTYSDETVAEMRALLAVQPPTSSPTVERFDRVVSADPPVTVRVHRPTNATGRVPAILGLHGGGYVIGNRSMDDHRFEHWCTHLGCVGVSVEYRLAPEGRYPAALDDCHQALRWLFEHAGELGVDDERIGVAGLSAGGGLAAALALLVRDQGELRLRFQVLEAPMLDDRQVTTSSGHAGMPLWSAEANAYGWQRYLGDRYGAADVPGYAAAARALDVSGLPPTFVSLGAVDGLRDEGLEYALRLIQADVPTELHLYSGAPHGFQIFAGTTLADRANRDLDEWLLGVLGLDHDENQVL